MSTESPELRRAGPPGSRGSSPRGRGRPPVPPSSCSSSFCWAAVSIGLLRAELRAQRRRVPPGRPSRSDTKSLTDEEQALQRDVDAYAAPDALPAPGQGTRHGARRRPGLPQPRRHRQGRPGAGGTGGAAHPRGGPARGRSCPSRCSQPHADFPDADPDSPPPEPTPTHRLLSAVGVPRWQVHPPRPPAHPSPPRPPAGDGSVSDREPPRRRVPAPARSARPGAARRPGGPGARAPQPLARAGPRSSGSAAPGPGCAWSASRWPWC